MRLRTNDGLRVPRATSSTGPFMVTRLYKQRQPADVQILDYPAVYPLTKDEIFQYLQGKANQGIQEKLTAAYTLHYYWGSWWRRKNTLQLQENLLLKKLQDVLS